MTIADITTLLSRRSCCCWVHYGRHIFCMGKD